MNPPSPEHEGAPLPTSLRRRLEHSAGVCLEAVRLFEGDVRPWTDAPAFAFGHRIFFRRGYLQPRTRWGQRLIAHEVAHVIQQFAGRVRPSPGRAFINDDHRLEAEADAFAERVLRGRAAIATSCLAIAPFQPAQPVLQCALGFEFQTGWRAYREVRTANAPTQLQELPKETVLYGGRQSGLGWTMETDGPEIELVIEPPLEDKQRVSDVFSRLQFFLIKLETAARRTTPGGARPSLRPSTHRDLFNAELRNENLVIIPDPQQQDWEKISAQPQVTVGVRLSRVHVLFAELARLGLQENDPTFDRHAPQSWFYSQVYRDVSQRANAAGLVQGRAPSQRLRGLMAMIAQYLRGGTAPGTRAYAKDMAYAMARTDFATMFLSLPDAERTYFQQNPAAWERYALQTAGLGVDTGNALLINQRISDGGALHPGSATPPVHLPLTRSAWLLAMAAAEPRDLLTASATAGDPLYTDGQGKNRLRALGMLGDAQDRVGPGKDGVIIELRQMQRAVPWPDWVKLAHAVMDFMIELNGRKIEAEQWPPQFDSTYR